MDSNIYIHFSVIKCYDYFSFERNPLTGDSVFKGYINIRQSFSEKKNEINK